MSSSPGRCIKCENPIANGGHEWCQSWARDEITKLRQQVKDLNEEIKDIEKEARAEVRELEHNLREAEREAGQW